MCADVTFVALCKGPERYVLLFEDANRGQALRMLGRWAGNPLLSFSWCDFALLAEKLKQTPKLAAEPEASDCPCCQHEPEDFSVEIRAPDCRRSRFTNWEF